MSSQRGSARANLAISPTSSGRPTPSFRWPFTQASALAIPAWWSCPTCSSCPSPPCSLPANYAQASPTPPELLRTFGQAPTLQLPVAQRLPPLPLPILRVKLHQLDVPRQKPV